MTQSSEGQAELAQGNSFQAAPFGLFLPCGACHKALCPLLDGGGAQSDREGAPSSGGEERLSPSLPPPLRHLCQGRVGWGGCVSADSRCSPAPEAQKKLS